VTKPAPGKLTPTMPAIRTRPDTLPTGLLLAGAGGFLDAYTFVGRGGVFANAQTGNIVLLGVQAGERHWLAASLHVPPILAFVLGVALAETLARPAARRIVRRPARFVLVAEIVVLVIAGALPPQVPNPVVTAAIAFTSALQVSTFRSLSGTDYSTMLTTSNLRTLVAKAYRWRADHDASAGRQAARIAGVVAGFAVGAGAGALCTRSIGPRAAWVAAAMLVLALAVIVIETAALSRRERSGGEEGLQGSDPSAGNDGNVDTADDGRPTGRPEPPRQRGGRASQDV
jgi:uncharacterized membrane protein YoaK (UPF0700 family)